MGFWVTWSSGRFPAHNSELDGPFQPKPLYDSYKELYLQK